MVPSIFQDRKNYNADRALVQIAELIKGLGFTVYATGSYEDWYTWTGVRMSSGIKYERWTPEFPQKQRISFKKNVRAWRPGITDFLSANAHCRYCVLLVFDGEWCELNVTQLRPVWCSCPNAVRLFSSASNVRYICPLCTISNHDAIPIPNPAGKPACSRPAVPRRVSKRKAETPEPSCCNPEQHPQPAGSRPTSPEKCPYGRC